MQSNERKGEYLKYVISEKVANTKITTTTFTTTDAAVATVAVPKLTVVPPKTFTI